MCERWDIINQNIAAYDIIVKVTIRNKGDNDHTITLSTNLENNYFFSTAHREAATTMQSQL